MCARPSNVIIPSIDVSLRYPAAFAYLLLAILGGRDSKLRSELEHNEESRHNVETNKDRAVALQARRRRFLSIQKTSSVILRMDRVGSVSVTVIDCARRDVV